MGQHARLADVALESAEDAVAILRRGLDTAHEHRRRAVEGGLLPANVLAVIDEILSDFERAYGESVESMEDIERASVGELIAASWLTGGPSPHLTQRARALGIEVGGLRLVVDNTPPRPRRPRAA